MLGNVNALPWGASMRSALGLPTNIKDSLVYLLDKPVEDAEYPNKIGDQDRVAVGGEIFPGRALAFDGVDQYASVADNGALDVNQASTDFVLSGWAKANADGNEEYLFGKYSTAILDGRYGFYKSSGNIVYFSITTSTGNIAIATPIDGDGNTDIHLFTARIDLTNSKIYVYTDGILENTGGTSFTGTIATLANDFEFYIGAGSNATGSLPLRFADTQIRDVRIYHKDVTSADNLASLQKGEALGDEVAWWFCEGNSTTRVDDSSGNNYHLTAANFDTTSFVEGNWQSLFNKYGYNNDGGTYIAPDMSDNPAVDDVDGTPLVFAGQAKYNAVARDRSCFIGDGGAYWEGAENIIIDKAKATVISFKAKKTTGTTAVILGGASSIASNIRISNLGYLYLETDVNGDQAEASLIVNDAEWHDYEITIINSVVSMKQDGVDLVMSDSAILNNTTFYKVGNFGTSYINGNISFISIVEDDIEQVNYQFCEGSGNTVYDVSGSNNHLTGVNVDETNWGVIDTPEEDYLAEHGLNAVGTFNGVDDYIDTNLDFSGATSFDMSVRLYRPITGISMSVLQGDVATARVGFEWFNDNTMYVFVSNGENSYGYINNTSTGWFDIRMVYNGSGATDEDKLKLYINDVLQILTYAAVDIPSSLGTISNKFLIGNDRPAATYTTGKISKVSLSKNGTTILDNYITGIDSEDTFGTWSGTGNHTSIIPALSDKTADALGQTLQYPQGGKNLVPECYISMPEDIKELYDADQQERYEELTSGDVIIGEDYLIIQHSIVDFTSVGAADNDVGTTFTASSTGVTLSSVDILGLKTTQTGNNLIENGGARNAIGALTTTDWNKTEGLMDIIGLEDHSSEIDGATKVRTLGNELVTSYDFLSSTGWILGESHSITGGKLVFDGTNVVSEYTLQKDVIEAGKVYLVEFVIENYVSGTFRVSTAGTVYSGSFTANGRYQALIHPNNPANGNLYLLSYVASTQMDINYFSVKEVTTATFIGTKMDYPITSSRLIDQIPQGAEELANGDFQLGTGTNADDWTEGTGWTRVDTGEGTWVMRAITSTANVYQVASTEVGKYYVLTYTISNYSAGTVHVECGNLSLGIDRNANGTYTEVLRALGNPWIMLDAVTSFTGDIDNVSVKELQVLGDDLVINGDFATDTDWNKGDGWSIAAGVASCDGTQTGLSTLVQSFVLTDGDYYIVKLTVSRSAGEWTIRLGSNYITSYSDQSGTLTIIGKSTAVNLGIYANVDFIGTVDNISVHKLTWGRQITDDSTNYAGFQYALPIDEFDFAIPVDYVAESIVAQKFHNGIADGWEANVMTGIPAIVTGNGFSGKAQKLFVGLTINTYLEVTTSPIITGDTYYYKFKHRSNNGFTFYMGGAAEDVSSNENDAIEISGIYTAENPALRVYIRNSNGNATQGDWIEIDELEIRPIIDGEFYEPEVLGAEPVIVLTNYFAENPYRYLTRYFSSLKWKDLILLEADHDLDYTDHIKLMKFTRNS